MRLIDADALFDLLIERQYSAQSMGILHTEYPNMRAIVSQQPTIDAVPVVHGRWLDCENYNDIEQCSVCGMIYRYPTFYRYNYCPNCGARMDGDGNG